MVRAYILIVFTSMLLFIACNQPADLTEYTYRYSMESMGNFKIEFQLNPDSTYRVGQHNYFFDQYERTPQPRFAEGKLTAEEYDTFTMLIGDSRLGNMDDSYGFDQSVPENSIVYSIELQQKEQSKFVVINAGANNRFSDDFNRLIKFTSDFVDDKLNE